MLCFHEGQISHVEATRQEYHRTMIEHYRLLLEQWGK
jgi:hypothetical protein